MWWISFACSLPARSWWISQGHVTAQTERGAWCRNYRVRLPDLCYVGGQARWAGTSNPCICTVNLKDVCRRMTGTRNLMESTYFFFFVWAVTQGFAFPPRRFERKLISLLTGFTENYLKQFFSYHLAEHKNLMPKLSHFNTSLQRSSTWNKINFSTFQLRTPYSALIVTLGKRISLSFVFIFLVPCLLYPNIFWAPGKDSLGHI